MANTDVPSLIRNVLRKLQGPFFISFFILLGGLVGYAYPEFGRKIAFVGEIYIDLLRMIVLPFMVSAVIFSLGRLFHNPQAGRFVKRMAGFFFLAMCLVAAVGILTSMVLPPSSDVDQQTRIAFGQVIQSDNTVMDSEITLKGGDVTRDTHSGIFDTIIKLIPSNIFSALSNGETIKVLLFSLLFGVAAAYAPKGQAGALLHALETVYQACQYLTRWFNLLLPFASFAMAAQQVATVGVGPVTMMVGFILTLLVAAFIILVICVVAIKVKTGLPFSVVVRSQQESFFMAVATRSSAACMPSMIESLVERLKLDKTLVELMVPLGVAILRIGPVLYYTVAVYFIAGIYGYQMTVEKVLVVFVISILAGLASSGMTSILAVAQTSLVCAYLGLPFEAAFVLFVAIDPVTDIIRTVLLVIGINATTVMVVVDKNLATKELPVLNEDREQPAGVLAATPVSAYDAGGRA